MLKLISLALSSAFLQKQHKSRVSMFAHSHFKNIKILHNKLELSNLSKKMTKMR